LPTMLRVHAKRDRRPPRYGASASAPRPRKPGSRGQQGSEPWRPNAVHRGHRDGFSPQRAAGTQREASLAARNSNCSSAAATRQFVVYQRVGITCRNPPKSAIPAALPPMADEIKTLAAEILRPAKGELAGPERRLRRSPWEAR